MTKTQIDTLLQIVQDGGIAALLVVALGYVAVKAINAWRDKKPAPVATNGNGTHKRVDKLGDVVVDNAKENAALAARFDSFEKQNEKEHNALRELIDKNNTRMHERFDELISLIRKPEQSDVAKE